MSFVNVTLFVVSRFNMYIIIIFLPINLIDLIIMSSHYLLTFSISYALVGSCNITRGICITRMNQSAVHARPLPAPRTLGEQGELIDRIEHHVTQAADYVDTGHHELHLAYKWAQKARKVMTTRKNSLRGDTNRTMTLKLFT